ncbi:DEKNAAC102349 [Brettanomyces naardenensis]|uniref:DEKNAAC102349 n=1 Tax=Brettanomyces naardenensis TaxID=13370 RepID=A0A448YLG4_BRENA|nr:DEKNAAC102349 [Brettanomyces naardenensis]
MRDSNNKSVLANKAAVSITSTLYDRRALDCTEDKPLVNSLNHLTFLASSSLKVREALSQDGGLERLVDILYECRNPQTEAEKCVFAWKWVLAFQSLVLVGTRGNEKMRRKVVEAGILPIIATILDNYLITRRMTWVSQFSGSRCPGYHCQSSDLYYDTSATAPQTAGSSGNATATGTNPPVSEDSANDNSTGDASQAFGYLAAQRRHSVGPSVNDPEVDAEGDVATADTDVVINDEITDTQVNTVFRQVRSLLDQANQTILEAEAEIGKHKHSNTRLGPRFKDQTDVDEEYHKVHRCLHFLRFLHRLNSTDDLGSIDQELMARYEDLTTDMVFGSHLATNKDISNLLKMNPSWITDLPFMKKFEEKLNQSVPREFENGVLIPKEDDVIWSLQLLAFISKYTSLRYEMADTYIVNGLSLRNYSIPPPLETDTGVQPEDLVYDDCDYFEFVDPTPPDDPFQLFPGFCNDQDDGTRAGTASSTLDSLQRSATMPPPVPADCSGDHCDLFRSYYDILQETDSLLEASKLERLTLDLSRYANREYSKLRLRNRQVYKRRLEGFAKCWNYENSWDELATPAHLSTHVDEEIKPIKRLNIFPLVEKFTVRHLYNKDINYWSSVIVRNSNRKDETKGGRRQCAYFGCGKWETEPRQFAKCRRCKRAKYCSKECQSKAWAYHKYWCNAVGATSSTDTGSSRDHESSTNVAASATAVGNSGSTEVHGHHHHHQQVEQGPSDPSAESFAPGVQSSQESDGPSTQTETLNNQRGNGPNAPTFQQGFFQ